MRVLDPAFVGPDRRGTAPMSVTYGGCCARCGRSSVRNVCKECSRGLAARAFPPGLAATRGGAVFLSVVGPLRRIWTGMETPRNARQRRALENIPVQGSGIHPRPVER